MLARLRRTFDLDDGAHATHEYSAIAMTSTNPTMRVAITGGSGFIGTNLIEHYAEAEVPVLNLDPAEPRNKRHTQHWTRIDPLDANQLGTTLGEFAPTHVFHLGARTDLHGTTLDDYTSNTRGVEAMIDACNGLSGIQRVVFASSRLVCRIGYQPKSDTDYCPPNAYGESKVRGERIVQAANTTFPWVIMRPTSIWGPWFDIPYRTFFLTIAANRYIHVGRRPVLKSFGYVGNTVQQLAAVGETSDPAVDGTTMYLADAPPIEVADMANRIQRTLGSKPIRTVPRRFVKPVALVGDLLQRVGWDEPPLTSFRLDNLLTEMIYDTEPLSRILPDLPYSLEEGITRTVEWMREQHLVDHPNTGPATT
jgi:nucleoside-diphosphate-sugar epimerase